MSDAPETEHRPTTSLLVQRTILLCIALLPIAMVSLLYFHSVRTREKSLGQWHNITAQAYAAPAADAAALEKGKQIYTQWCAVCHMPDGSGKVGAPLTAANWKHAESYADAFKTVAEGVSSTQMIPWKNTLSPDEVHAVASYVWQLKGTAPIGPKKQ
jgi:mono/diheme cytochrome c family protein